MPNILIQKYEQNWLRIKVINHQNSNNFPLMYQCQIIHLLALTLPVLLNFLFLLALLCTQTLEGRWIVSFQSITKYLAKLTENFKGVKSLPFFSLNFYLQERWFNLQRYWSDWAPLQWDSPWWWALKSLHHNIATIVRASENDFFQLPEYFECSFSHSWEKWKKDDSDAYGLMKSLFCLFWI